MHPPFPADYRRLGGEFLNNLVSLFAQELRQRQQVTAAAKEAMIRGELLNNLVPDSRSYFGKGNIVPLLLGTHGFHLNDSYWVADFRNKEHSHEV
jgi:hypothetical protein